MTLISGSRLGPYEILSTLGAGGMGEVYRARDAKLNRDVRRGVFTDQPHKTTPNERGPARRAQTYDAASPEIAPSFSTASRRSLSLTIA